MTTNGRKTREETIAHITFRQVVVTSLITAVSTIFITLISSGYFRQAGAQEKLNDLQNAANTLVHTDPVKEELWTDVQDYFIWFNAQYKNASTVHDKNHFSLMKGQVKYTLVLIQPNRNYQNDFINFEGKFSDMRKYLRNAKTFGDKEGWDVSRAFPEIYLFKEEKIPSLSFFLTKNKKNQDKAIVYLEEKGYFMGADRRPILCLETGDPSLIKKFESRYKDLLIQAQPINRLEFNKLISELPDSTFFLK